MNREKTLQRARLKVKRLANSNADLTKFFTLTFAENMTDLKQANLAFKNFILRLRYYCECNRFPDLKYIAVVEFQKRGAVHYHLLCNLPYINAKTLAEIWENGFIKINRIENVDNVGAYVTKYMQKDSADERLTGNRCFFTSQNLAKPVVITDTKDIETVLNDMGDVVKSYVKTFQSDWLGMVNYTQLIFESAHIKKPIVLPPYSRGFAEQNVFSPVGCGVAVRHTPTAENI